MGTTGTTVLGACDDLNAVADVCQKHGVWFHVDVSKTTTCNKTESLKFPSDQQELYQSAALQLSDFYSFPPYSSRRHYFLL